MGCGQIEPDRDDVDGTTHGVLDLVVRSEVEPVEELRVGLGVVVTLWAAPRGPCALAPAMGPELQRRLSRRSGAGLSGHK